MIGQFIILPAYADFWLRSVVGERGKWSGGRREAFSASQPECNVPSPSRRRKPAACCGNLPMPARDERIFCEAERARSQGKGATVKPVERRKKCVGHGGTILSMSRSREIPFNPTPSFSWTGAFMLGRHKNCMVFVTMKMKAQFEPQYPRGLDSGFGLAIGAREWNEGGAEKHLRSRAAV